jgi:hypothetical protein
MGRHAPFIESHGSPPTAAAAVINPLEILLRRGQAGVWIGGSANNDRAYNRNRLCLPLRGSNDTASGGINYIVVGSQ